MPLPIVVFTSDQEKRAYEAYFNRACPSSSSLFKLPTKDSVISLFKQSGLPEHILAKIWDMVSGSSQNIDQMSFNVGLRLIAIAQQSSEPNLLALNKDPVPVPRFTGYENILQIAGIDLSKYQWPISNEERSKFRDIFTAYAQGQHHLTLEQAYSVFLGSGISHDVLQRITVIADYDKDNRLDLDEFCVGMHMIYEILEGTRSSVPYVIPLELIPPSKRAGQISQIPLSPPTAQESAAPVPVRQPSYEITSEKLEEYQNAWLLFAGVDPVVDNSIIDLMATRLSVSNALCEQAWSLVDFNRNGKLNEKQLQLFLHLMDEHKKGTHLPALIPVDIQHRFSK